MEHASASEGGALRNFAEVVLDFKNLMLKFIHIFEHVFNFYEMNGAEGPEELQAYGNEVELHSGPRCCSRRQCSGHFFKIPPYSSSPRG
jgi:hypothetical protein